MQIMIYLFCVYLVFKGIEIFQIAYVSSGEDAARKFGIQIGGACIVIAVLVAILTIFLEESIAAQVADGMNNIPKF